MKITYKEKISITGKVVSQKVVFTITGLKPMYLEPNARGGWFTRFGDGHMRMALARWLRDEFGTESPPFDTIFERVKALNPAPPNPKGMTWLR